MAANQCHRTHDGGRKALGEFDHVECRRQPKRFLGDHPAMAVIGAAFEAHDRHDVMSGALGQTHQGFVALVS